MSNTLIYRFDGWKLDLGRRQLLNQSGHEIRLTSYEFDMLTIFCQNPRQCLPRKALAPYVNGQQVTFDRAVDVRVTRLRYKIEKNSRSPDLIKTIRQGGYWFTPDVTTE